MRCMSTRRSRRSGNCWAVNSQRSGVGAMSGLRPQAEVRRARSADEWAASSGRGAACALSADDLRLSQPTRSMRANCSIGDGSRSSSAKHSRCPGRASGLGWLGAELVKNLVAVGQRFARLAGAFAGPCRGPGIRSPV